jgi:hypothetical protein
MKWLFAFGILFGLFFLISSCGASSIKRIEALKPEASTDNLIVYKNKTSFVALPVEVSLQDIQKQLNKNLDGLIYHDSILDGDNTEMKIWKSRAIELTEEKGTILSEIPLKIWTKVRYGTKYLGLNDTKEIYMDGVLYLESTPHLSNWKLTTKSKIVDLKWNESPSIMIAGKLVPITYLVNPTVSYFKKTIATEIDKAIDETCDFKPYVLDALETISKPIKVNEEYETWFKLIPVELYTTNAKLNNKSIKMDMGLKCTLQTIVGDEPKNTFDKNKIILKPVSRMPEKVELALAAVSTYKSASKIITKNFKGQEFGSGSKKVTVQNVEIWQKDSKLIIALNLIGSVTGTIYLSGYPSYNSVTKEIFFDQLDYVLNTKSVLLKSANWLAQGTILKKIQENCRYSIKENLEEGETTLAGYLNNYSPTKGVFINGAFTSIEFEKVELTDKAIIAFLTTSGKVSVKIDGVE